MEEPTRAPRRPAALALALATALAGCGRSESAAPRQVVLVVVDTLRRDALGCYGGPAGATPQLDALAAEGVRFEQAIASSSWTLPSVGSLLTGAWPEVHKAMGQKTLLTPVSPDVPLAAELFEAAGFTTVAVVNAAFLSPLLGIDRGFERFDHRHAFNRGRDGRGELRRADESVEAALRMLRDHRDEDVFALVHLFDPHLDYDPLAADAAPFLDPPPLSLADCRALEAESGTPAPGDVAYVRALYQAEVTAVDRAVGRLVAGLRELGMWERCALVVVSDHGEELWEHGGFEHGHAMYDELIRVPLVLKPPASSAPWPERVEEQVRLIDVLPTLLELHGMETPPSCAGRSLLPLLRGAPDAARPGFSQDTLYGSDLLSWRTERWHLVYDRGAGVERRVQLFDWRADPHERTDLAAEEPALVEALHGELARFYAELKRSAAGYAQPATEDLGPSRVRRYLESLESLGYAGRDE